MGNKILLVEGDSDLAIVEKTMLERHGFEVTTAVSRGEAREKLEKDPGISLLLVGIESSEGMGGIEIARTLLDQHELPIVFLSDHSERKYLECAARVPHHGYVLRSSGEFILADTLETALQSSHRQNTAGEHLRTTLQSIGDGVISTDTQGRVVEMNPSAETLTGWVLKDARGRALEEVFQIENAFTGKKVENPIRRVLGTGRTTNLANHTKLISKNGREHHIADSAAPIRDDEGELRGVVLVFRDVTDLYEKDRQLLERVKELDCLYRISEIVEIQGISLREILQKTAEVLPPSWKYPEDTCSRILLDKDVYTSEHFEVTPWKQSADLRVDGRKAGSVEVFYRTEKPTKDEGPFIKEERKLINAVAERLGRIIERKRSQEALSRSLFRLEETNRLAHIGLWSWEQDTDTVVWSKELYEIAGRNPAAPAPTYTEHPGLYTAHSWEKLQASVEQSLSNGTTYRLELELIRPGGELRYVIAHGGATYDESGRITGLYGTVQDITDRKKIERNLEKALEEKTFLMKELNHRVKNNLTIIASLIGLKDQELGDSVDLSGIRHQIDAIRIIHEKLYRSDRIRSINVRDYLNELLAAYFSTFTRRGEVVVESNIESFEIPAGTAVPLGLIINELATNAVKHGFDGTEKSMFRVNMHRDSKSNQCILHISNTGRAFPQDVDIHSAKSLGLQLVATLVNQIHGKIELSRDPYTVYTLIFSC